MRYLFLTLGCCAAALGLAGAVLPGLPTTVFVLAAAYCFTRSSPRLSAWLVSNRWLGPPLARFAATGGLPVPVKRAALLAMWTSVAISAAVLAPVRPVLALGILSLGGIATLVILFGVRTAPQAPTGRPDAGLSVEPPRRPRGE